jgi:crotonobetainyl-CoA:carnitine CoA-transferase CaiB-like acyl-CoA transferase
VFSPAAGRRLAELGAEVVRIDRPGAETPLDRGAQPVLLDLDRPAAVETCLKLVHRADALIDGLGPGLAERLGFGPDIALARNPALVYARLLAPDEAQAAHLALGVLAAVMHARATGEGQVVESGTDLWFARTPGALESRRFAARELLSDWGLEEDEIDSLERQGVL